MTNQRILRYAAALGGIALATALLAPFQAVISSTIAALALLMVVLFAATFVGRNPAFLASVAGALCFNYFFLPPLYTLHVAEPINWIALGAFLITALVAGELSASAQRRAEEAETKQREIERLYEELQAAFEQASHAEAFRRSEKLKSALLDAVTHDLRTPLTSIKAAVTTLLEDEKTDGNFRLDAEGKQEFLEIIDEETDRLNKFIEEMVELAKFEAGALNLRQIWSAVDVIVRAAVKRAENSLKNHRVRLEIEKELPVARVDAKALSEVVYTLLDNAAKYSPPQTAITIAARRGASETIEISVEDEGSGVPTEMRERVFDKFFRVRLGETGKQTAGGLGLGLAIARGIVESHGGKIWIETGANGRGAKVTFTVPIGDEEK